MESKHHIMYKVIIVFIFLCDFSHVTFIKTWQWMRAESSDTTFDLKATF